MSFSITILGSSSALPTSKRYLTAHLLTVDEHFFLIDCGEGTQIQLRKNKIKINKINNIFISHLHGDHIFGLFGLLSTFDLLGRNHDLNIYAHKDINKVIEFFIQNFGKNMEFKINIFPINPRRKDIIYEDNKITVQQIPLKHRVPTCGFLFREKPKIPNIRKEMVEYFKIPFTEIIKIKSGSDYITPEGKVIPNNELLLPMYHTRSYAYCSDTAYKESIIPIIENVDILYHEATFLNKDKDKAKDTYHSTAAQAADIALKSHAKKLLIGHFSARYKTTETLLSEAKKIFSNTFAVEDGDIYELELQRDSD